VRIAAVVHGYPPIETAGVELVAKEQADALAARGHQVSVFARMLAPDVAEGTTRDDVVDGIPVRRVASDLGERQSFRALEDTHVFDDAFGAFLAEQRPDVVHVQHLVLLSPNLLRVARDAGCAVVLSLHDAFYLCHRLFLLDRDGHRCPGPEHGTRCVRCLDGIASPDDARWRFDFMARALDRADVLVAPSHALARRYVDAMPFLAGRVVVVDPGIRTLPPAPSVPAADARVRFLFTGTWLPHKGLDLLLDALAELDPARWRLAVHGDGVLGHEAYVAAQRERTRALPVTWAGPYAPEALPDVLGSSDVLVLPSRCDESYSRVVREARRAGLAVIAPATGGPAEALRHEVDALLVEPDDRGALTEALARLLDEPGLVARLRAASTTIPTVEEGVARLENLLAETIARVRRRPAPGAAVPRVSVAQRSPDAEERVTPRATILIPSYNHAAFVADAVASALAQSERAVEVLVIDDGSTDDSVARLARFSDPRLEVRIQSNVGLSTTLNRGLARASAPWVKFLPSDDVLQPDCIARQLAAAERLPSARVVLALPEVVDAALVPLANPAAQAWFDTPLRTRDEILRGLLERNFLCAPGALFDRALALEVGGFDPVLRIAQDYDLWMKLLARAPAAFVAERLVRVRWHGANQSAVVTPASEAERARVVLGALERVGLDGWVELFRAAPGAGSTEQAKQALAAALRRSGLREVEPWVARLLAATTTSPVPAPSSSIGTERSSMLGRIVARLRPRAAIPPAAPITRGPRVEHWLVLAPGAAASDPRSAAIAAALARDGATVTLAASSSAADVPPAVRHVPADLAALRALLRDRDERIRVLVQQPDAAAIALVREVRLRGVRVLYDKWEGATAISRAAIDSERALIDAADDLVGGARTTVKQLAIAKRLVHLLPDASDDAGWDERARALRGIAARPTVAVVVACLPWHDAATIAACLDRLEAVRGDVAYRIVAVDDGAPAAAVEELERREEGGRLVLLRNALRGRGSGFNLALRAIAAEVVVLLDATRRPTVAGWLDAPLRALVDQRACAAVTARSSGGAPGTGWAWVAARTALARSAGFDEAFDPASLEDLDLAQQLRALGYDVAPWSRADGSPAEEDDAAAVRGRANRHAERHFRRRWKCSVDAALALDRTRED